MRLISRLLLILTFLPLSACAKTEAPSKSVDPALWVVRDTDTTIYLFGTIHVLKPETVWFDDEVKAAFDRSHELVLEMIPPPPEEMAKLLQTTALNTSAPPFTQAMDPKSRAALAAAGDKLGQPISMLEKFDPWWVAIQLSMGQVTAMGYDGSAGPEEVLANAAKQQGKWTYGLETAAFQFSIFDSMPLKDQIVYLNDTVKQLPKENTDFAKLMAAWEKGDDKQIAKLMNDSEEMNPALKDALIYKRNANWATWVKQRMAKPGAVFIAVGVGHLSGSRSVIDDLARMGLKPARVKKADFGL